jgi:hypothetical protein
VIAAMFALEFLARRPGSRIPTVGQWLGYLMRPRIGRVLVCSAGGGSAGITSRASGVH